MTVNTMDKMLDKILDVVESLYPTPDEYGDNGKFFYWMDYACELDDVMSRIHGGDDWNSYVNQQLKKFVKDTAKYDAYVDVASSLEEVIPSKFKGVFVYE